MPEELARRIADLRALDGGARHRAGRRPRRQAGRRCGRDLFRRRGRSSSSTASPSAARDIVVTDYFDRLALDRALDSIGDAERRLTAAMVGNGATGAEAVEAWVDAAPGRGRAHPRRDPRDRRLGADAVEALGGGEPAGRSGAAVICVMPREDAASSSSSQFEALDRPPSRTMTAGG